MEQKIRYVEIFPKKIEKIFETLEEYNAFAKQRFDEVFKELDLNCPTSKYKYYDWKHTSTKLNKDGTPRKYYNPIHLQTKKARRKQEEKFRKFLDKKRKEAEERRLQQKQLDEEAYCKAIKVLCDNKIDINRLDIKIKQR